jgi:DNA damage-binding protein 1
MSLLCVGVTSYDDGEREPSRGRLVLLQADCCGRASLVVMASVSVGGCVYAITSVQNLILAAVNSSVSVVVSFCKHGLTLTSLGHCLHG